MGTSGGAAGAVGFQFQYLYTILTLLDQVEAAGEQRCVVTIEDVRPTGVGVRTMDFALHAHGRETFVEIKYRSGPAATGPAEVLAGLIRMTEFGEADRYLYVSNRAGSAGVAQLGEILASDADEAELRRQLAALMGRAPKTNQLVSSIDPAQIPRLRRCRVTNVTGDLDQLYLLVKERVFAYRRAHGLALGADSGEVLLGRLISAVFQRATHSAGSQMDTVEFEQLLATGPYVLARALGIDDTAIGIGRVPAAGTVFRSRPFGSLSDALNSGICSDRPVYCALYGRSGIGKSRLAASFAHAHRHAYDRFFWFNAASTATLAASVAEHAWMLGLEDVDTSDADRLAASFRHTVAQFPGTWLIVFDDASTASALQPWIPSTGWGHVLVTTLDQRGWQEFTRIGVDTFAPGEATELLRVRLAATPEHDHELDALAEGLGYWPLALEVAAAYIGSSQNLQHSAAAYLAEVKGYAIGDPTLELPGYPRSLLAAISMCIDRIDQRSATHRPAEVARRMLTVAAHFAQQNIPAEFTYQSALTTVDEALADAEHDKPALRRDAAAPPLAAQAVLQSVSIVDFDRRTGPRIQPEFQAIIEMNDIVQQIVRARGDATKALESTALQLSNWIYRYLQQGDYPSAMNLAQHGAHLLLHAGPAAEAPWEVASLAGNLAHMHQVSGSHDAAIRLLDFELAVLLRHQRSPLNVVQTAAALVQTLLVNNSPEHEILHVAESLLDFLEDNAGVVESETAAKAVLAAEQVVAVLHRSAAWAGTPTALYDSLLARCADRLARTSSSPTVQREAKFRELQDHFDKLPPQQDEVDLALDYARLHGDDELVNALNAQAMVVNAYARAARFDEAMQELARLRARMDQDPFLVTGLPDRLLNTTIELLIPMLFCQPVVGLPLIFALLNTATEFPLEDFDAYRHRVATAAWCAASGDLMGAQQLADWFDHADPPELPHMVLALDPILALGYWVSYWVESKTAGREPVIIDPDAIAVGRAITPDGETRRSALIAVEDRLYQEVRSRSIRSAKLVVSCSPLGNSKPLFMVLRASDGSPICGISTAKSNPLHRHEFDLVILRTSNEPLSSPVNGLGYAVDSRIHADVVP